MTQRGQLRRHCLVSCLVDLWFKQCWAEDPSDRPSAEDLVEVFTSLQDDLQEPLQAQVA